MSAASATSRPTYRRKRKQSATVFAGVVTTTFTLDIPRRTALSWIRRGVSDVVTLDPDEREPALRDRVVHLERRIAMLTAVLRLVLVLLRISGFELERARVPDAASNGRLLSAIERARTTMPLSAALRVLRLSAARYHAWAHANAACVLDDRPSCPRSVAQRLTYREVETIGDVVQSMERSRGALPRVIQPEGLPISSTRRPPNSSAPRAASRPSPALHRRPAAQAERRRFGMAMVRV